MQKTLGQLFEGVEDRLDALEEKLDEILDLARVQGITPEPPEDAEDYLTEWAR